MNILNIWVKLINNYPFFFFVVNMINISYLQYIPEEIQEQLHYNLMVDVFYFYHGYKPNNYQTIKCINGNMYDLDKNNLVLIDI